MVGYRSIIATRVQKFNSDPYFPTLPYDGAIVRDNQRGKPLPASRWASVTIPALVMDGGKSPAWIRRANRSLATLLPNAQYRTLERQTHMLKPKAHAPMLAAFFTAGELTRRGEP